MSDKSLPPILTVEAHAETILSCFLFFSVMFEVRYRKVPNKM